MARRNDHTPEELKELVLQQTRSLLDQVPAAQLSLRKIAKQVGYAPSTLIALFGNYNSLLLQLNSQTLEEIYQQTSKQANKDLRPNEVLLGFARVYHEYAMKNPHQWELVFDHKVPEGEEIPETHQTQMAKHFESIEMELRKINPHSSNIEIIKTARTIWACVHGITVLSVNNKLFVQQDLNGLRLIESFMTHYLKSWSKK